MEPFYYIPIILALGRLSQDESNFQNSLSYIEKPELKKQTGKSNINSEIRQNTIIIKLEHTIKKEQRTKKLLQIKYIKITNRLGMVTHACSPQSQLLVRQKFRVS